MLYCFRGGDFIKFVSQDKVEKLIKKDELKVNYIEKNQIDYYDKYGYRYYQKVDNFLRQDNYVFAISSNPYVIDNIKKYLEINDINLQLLSNKYKSAKSKMLWRCSCGNVFKRCWSNIRNGQIHCLDCAKDNNVKGSRHTKEFIVKEFKVRGYDVINAEDYKNKNTMLYAKGEDGYIYAVTYSSLKKVNKLTLSLSKYNKYNEYNINKHLKDNNIDFSLVEIMDGAIIKLRCNKCEEEVTRPWKDVRRYGIKCLNCDKTISKGEVTIRNYLKKHGIRFETQASFSGCRYKLPLKFDFKLFIGDNIILIEFDGVQHFRPIERFGGSEYFQIRKERDEIKNKYCKDNNIPLYRLTYLDFDNHELENKLEKIIKQYNN